MTARTFSARGLVHLADWLEAQGFRLFANHLAGQHNTANWYACRYTDILAAVALLVAGQANAACMWTDPGANRFTGDPVAAVRAYADIPAAEREELAAAVAAHAYSEQVEITRDSIGAGRYTEMRNMHWGDGRLCIGPVDRRLWGSGQVERGLIYRVRGYAVIVPSVCGNVARITDTQDRPDMHKPATPVPNSTMRRWLAGGSAPRVNQAPEPSTAWLVLAAVVGVAISRRKSRGA